MNVLALHASPRRGGNSDLLARAFLEGAAEAGHSTGFVHLPARIREHLRDCRLCRGADGSCTIGDGYQALLLDEVIGSDAVAYATPLWWYGGSGYLKSFLDRLFCFLSDSFPRHREVMDGLVGQRIALLVAAEETYPGALSPLVAQVQELARYLHQPFVGVVRGTGNTRGEVARDPQRPLDAARELGRTLFDVLSTDYRVDTDRPNAVWQQED